MTADDAPAEALASRVAALLGRRPVAWRRTAGGYSAAGRWVVRFEDGSTVIADLVVGADGIRSAVRDVLVSDQPRFSGQAVYRGLVAADRVAHLLGEPTVSIWLGPGQHCVCYPVSAGAWVSFVAVAPDDPHWRGRSATESWTAPGRVADLLAAYAGWPERVRGVLAAADSVTRWALHDRAALPRWHTRRVTVIGARPEPEASSGWRWVWIAGLVVAIAIFLMLHLQGGGAMHGR